MANLVIDIGNTFSKVAVFDNHKLIVRDIFENLTLAQIKNYIGKYNISSAIISSVAGLESSLEQVLQSLASYIRFSAETVKNIHIHYKTPATLGLDRLAAVIGARYIYPAANTLVIDAGTCITCDFIDAESNYYGGSISPGISMRLQAMNAFTQRLPLVEAEYNFKDWTGNDTKSSILSGALQGAFAEVRGFIEYYTEKYLHTNILLCGGDANFFDTRLKNSIFADAVKTEPNLVLIGLNEVIHQYND